MNTVTLPVEAARTLVIDAFLASRTSRENAIAVAKALIGAELDGQAGHGLRRVPAYAAQARAGKVNGFAVPSAERVRPGVVRIDAGSGFAYPAIDLAIAQLDGMARSQGMAMAGIFHSHHAGVAGLAVEALADRGLVALMLVNTPAAMAPWGGRRALFGTDPIAFACPIAGGEPIVVDVSLSKVARGKVMAAAQAGEAIPAGWALDADGRPTTDAKAAMAGTMVPLGEAKGTALALMVELLCAGLTGANYAYEATSYFDDKGAPPNTGQVLIAIDPDAFGPGIAVERFAHMAAAVEGEEGARLPGRRRQTMRRSLAEAGIRVDETLVEQIRAIAA